MPFIFRLPRNYTLVFSLLWLAAIFITLGDRHPQPWPDESLYADIVRNWVETKAFGIPMFAGYLDGVESHQHFYPPLYFLASGLFFHAVPLTLLTFRLFSYLSLIAGAAVLVWSVVRPWGPKFMAPAILLFIFDPSFLRGALIGRMDAFAVLMVLVALSSLHASETCAGRKATTLRAVSGFFSGLAFLTHPMAWSAPFGLCLYFLFRVFRREAKLSDFATYLLAAFLAIAPYLAWLYLDWDLFAQQFAAQIERKQLLAPRSFGALLSRYDRYFNAYGVAKLFGIILALFGWVGLFKFAFKDSRGAKFLFVHCVVVALALYSGEVWYPIYYLSTSIIGFFWLAAHWQKKWFPRLVQVTAFSFLVGTIGIGIGLRSKSYAGYCKEINQLVQPSESIFLASTPDAYFCFPSRPPKLAQFVPSAVQVPRARAEAVLDQFDVIIMGLGPAGDATIDYMNARSDQFTFTQKEAGGYNLTVARRKPTVSKNQIGH